MKSAYIIFAVTLLISACATPPNTTNPTSTAMPTTQKTVHLISNYDFTKTIDRLKSTIKSKGMTIFATIDHAQAAKDHNLSMQPATVLIFGNPKVGTPLMVKDPSFALQLPLKVLITQTDGQVQVIYTPANTLIKGSQITPTEVATTLANAEKLIQATIK